MEFQEFAQSQSEIPSVDEVLDHTLKQMSTFMTDVGEKKAKGFISDTLAEISRMDTVAKNRFSHIPKTQEEAAKIRAIIAISGPGTYQRRKKEDKYKEYKWAENMDHNRLEYTGFLIRKLTEAKTGQRLVNDPDLFYDYIEKFAPELFYTGNAEETTDVLQSLQLDRIHMPHSKVHILGKSIQNTVDQVEQLALPQGFDLKPGEQIGFVLHSPQAVRLMRNMGAIADKNRVAQERGRVLPFPSFPFTEEGGQVRIFPLPIPSFIPDPNNPSIRVKAKEYVANEVRGLVYYTFYASPPLARETSFPYQT